MSNAAPFALLQLATLRDDYPAADSLPDLLSAWHPGGYLTLHPAHTLTCQPPLTATLTPADLHFFYGKPPAEFHHAYPFPPTTLAALPHAHLVGPDFIVITGDRRVLTDSFSGDHILQGSGHFQKRALQIEAHGRQTLPFVLYHTPPPTHTRTLTQPAILIAHHWHFNYHHWLVECLPRLRVALETPALADYPLIVPATLTAFQRDSLALLGVPPARLLPFDATAWHFPTLFFPSIGSFSPTELQWLRARANKNPQSTLPALNPPTAPRDSSPASLSAFAPSQEFPSPPPESPSASSNISAPLPSAPLPGTRLYISRTDATTRRLLNEPALTAILLAHGFEILTLTAMPFAEQVARFAEAAYIIGPHGSGLTNTLFAPPHATLIELMPHDQVNHCFWLMTNGLNQRYTFLSGPVASAARDFTIAPAQLEALLAALNL